MPKNLPAYFRNACRMLDHATELIDEAQTDSGIDPRLLRRAAEELQAAARLLERGNRK